MKACRYACVFALGAAIVEACGGDLPKAETVAVPPGLPPDASLPPLVVEHDAAPSPNEKPALDVQFIQGQTRIAAPPCSRVYIAVAEGKATTAKDVLNAGDVMIVKFPDDLYVDVDGLALRVIHPFPCSLSDKPGAEVTVRRANQAPELSWGPGGLMHGHLDVGTDVSPDLYLGRLSGTLGVAEHVHETSIEVLATINASGTMYLDGKPQHIGSRQIVTVPMNTPHRWKPDLSTNLVAIQLYVPPGPEQRFVKLAAEYKDAGSPPFDAGAVPTSVTRPGWCPVADWDSWRHRCLKPPPPGLSPPAAKPPASKPAPAPAPAPASTSRPTWCAIEDWDSFSHRCLKPKP